MEDDVSDREETNRELAELWKSDPAFRDMIPLDYLLEPNLKTLPYPTTIKEAFDGGNFWEILMMSKSQEARLSALRVALLICGYQLDGSAFKLEDHVLEAEAERFGRTVEAVGKRLAINPREDFPVKEG
jgi:hypothetical protein